MRIGNIAFDCDDVLRVARFWSGALERPLDAGSGPEFASIGGTDADRSVPAWYFTKVPEPRTTTKNRVHVDLTTSEPDAVARLVELGATVIGGHELPGGAHHWIVLQDPEGNEFCLASKSFTGWTRTD